MDNKNIFNRVKMKIAISKLEEEDIVMNKNILKNVVITMCALMATTGVVFGAATIINKFGLIYSLFKRRFNSRFFYVRQL